ncbi:MAG: hypothetical protein IKX43_00760 [Paludibacteraceae bacterium]|nr:hypothetical protein [Paludibacteraceae bacterium]
MKKLLLLIGSWAMILAGTVAFTSCGDDDKEENNVKKGEAAELFESCKGLEGAKIVGDDVIYQTTHLNSTITVFHFSGDKVEVIKEYVDYLLELNVTNWEASMPEDYKDYKTEGQYVIFDKDIEPQFQNISKQELCNKLNSEDGYKFFCGMEVAQ